MRFPTAAPLLLAALLLSPIAASAQTPPPAKAISQKVYVQVNFVTVDTEDLDALGINFGFIVLTASPRTFLGLAEGNIVPQMYQALTRTAARIGSHTISLAPIIVSDNIPAVFAVNTQVPINAPPRTLDQGHSDFPQLTGSGQLRGKITLIPQIVPGNFVRLDILSPIGSNQRMRFRTVPSGQQVVMYVAVVPTQVMTSGRRIIPHMTELLIFITPTIVPETTAPATVPAVKPQLRDHSSGLSDFGTGFGPARPSAVLGSTRWLNSLHWSSGSNISKSNINGTIGRPSLVIEAPPFLNGVKRIYAL